MGTTRRSMRIYLDKQSGGKIENTCRLVSELPPAFCFLPPALVSHWHTA